MNASRLTRNLLPTPALLGALALAAAGPSFAAAQGPPDTSAAQHIRQEIRERWIHENQPESVVRFVPHTRAFRLREILGRSARNGPRWAVDFDNRDFEVSFDSAGRIFTVHVELPRASHYPGSPSFSTLYGVRRLQGPGEVLRLPSSPFHELWLELPETPLAPGLTWTDTLSFVDEPALGMHESYHATRTHRVVGDSVLNGRSLPRIRTEAEVRYASTSLEFRLAHVQRISRQLTGRTVAAMVVDTATGLKVAGVDTASWQGTATLHDTVSGPYQSAVRYERTRTWSWYDSARHQAFTDSARAARERRSTGMLVIPTNPLEVRLLEGDSLLADSLATEWRLSRDADDIVRIESLLRYHAHAVGWTRMRLDSLAHVFALARGDTAAAITTARRAMPYQVRERLTRVQAEFLVPYLDDPERYWRLGVPEWYDFTELARTVLRASPLLEPDTSRWGCLAEACEVLLNQFERASEPRLRDLALVGLFARDPVRWYDRLVERHEAGSSVTAEAVRMARGIPEDVSPRLPDADADADWKAWRAWWGARPGQRVNYGYALRLHAALTGRDAVAELAADWPPEGDSARAVVGEILRHMGALPDPTVDELVAEVLSGDPARVNRATRSLTFTSDTVPPDDVAHLLGPLLDSLVAGGDAPWPAAAGAVPEGEPRIYREARSTHGVDDVPLFVVTEGLPASVIERLPEHVQAITPEDWRDRDPRAGGYLLRFHPVRRAGPFVSLGWRWTAMRRRAPDEAPAGYAGGGSLELVETEGGWLVVGRSAWIT